MRFAELQEQDKIQAVKDQFISIVERIHTDHNVLKLYLKIEEPKLETLPLILETENGDPAILARNGLARTAANITNEKIIAECNSKKAAFDAIIKRISSFKKKEDCKCPASLGFCLDVNLTSGVVNSELELLIDAARTEAQNKTY
jgi:hypothetical protein